MRMPIPSLAPPPVPRQLPLPLDPPPRRAKSPSPPPIPPAQLWASLPPDQRRQIRQAVLRIAREVVRDAAAH